MEGREEEGTGMDAARSYGSLIVRIVELHSGPAKPNPPKRRQRFVSLKLESACVTTSHQLEDVWIEQFVLPVGKPKSELVVEVHEKGRLFSSIVGRLVLRLEALEMEKLVEDAFRVEQGQLASQGCSLRLILLKTTLTQQEVLEQQEMGLDEQESLRIAQELKELDDVDVDGEWVVMGKDVMGQHGVRTSIVEPQPAARAAEKPESTAALKELLARMPIACTRCRVKLTVDLVSLDCAHLYCGDCFATSCGDAVARNAFGELSCCGLPFPDYLLRRVLSESAMSSVVDARFGPQDDLSRCPQCEAPFIPAPGEAADDTPEAHRQLHRFRCRNCNTDFCNSCKRSPYHDKYTCVGYEVHLKSRRCRFCHSAMPDSAPEAQLHCNDCNELWQIGCKKQLKCGHHCNGVDGERECLPCLYCPLEPQHAEPVVATQGGTVNKSSNVSSNNNNNSKRFANAAQVTDSVVVLAKSHSSSNNKLTSKVLDDSSEGRSRSNTR